MHDTLKPYLINAFYSWCMDIGYTPLLSVQKWSNNVLPSHLINDSNVIFNIHPKAIRNLIFGKDTIEFEAMFNTQAYQIILDYNSIANIHTKEDEYGLNFEVSDDHDIPRKPLKKPNLILIKNEEKDEI